MTRSIPLTLAATFLLMAGCDGAKDAGNTAVVAGDEAVADGNTVEDLPSDGLAAPSNMALETESNTVGSASGGNAM
ncbi:hypothetical protein [Sphingomonas solaris]|uniref:Circumsporozoite protein n=1 Tax=Alterirhizorhabdus solaris TaxID=2529389 RepID=A0A558QVT2_9SPHN|nr:hypothetical protein [Sphingomonas solaris]TVV71235.1 hypothetical protein FOY91_17320 [Sphingomonas solaris]